MNVTYNSASIQPPNGITNASGTESHFTEPVASKAFRLVVFSIIILASLLGNSLVLKAVLELPRRYKPFTYYLVANMAVAEIISSICLPFTMVYAETHSWIFGQFPCRLIIPLQVTAIIVVTSDMAAIAIYRYRVMTSPLKKQVKTSVMLAVIGGIWLVAFALSLPLAVTRILVEHPLGHKVCMSKFPIGDQKNYTIVRFVLSYIAPYLVMLCSYGAVAVKLRRRQLRRNLDEVLEITMTTTTSRSNSYADPRAAIYVRPRAASNLKSGSVHKSSVELERDLLRMIYAIILSFVVCYIPYQALFLWEHIVGINNSYHFRYQAMLRQYFYVLTCYPSALHPLCYGTMNRFFARAFSKIVMCRR